MLQANMESEPIYFCHTCQTEMVFMRHKYRCPECNATFEESMLLY